MTARERPVRSTVEMTRAEFDAFLDGVSHGYGVGYADGWRAADDHAASLHRHAGKILDALADAPARNPEFATGTDEELRAAATERRRRGIERFRADHARRRTEVRR